MTEEPITQRNHNHYNPVKVHAENTVGAILLGILAIMLLVALLRAQAQIRRLAQPAGDKK